MFNLKNDIFMNILASWLVTIHVLDEVLIGFVNS